MQDILESLLPLLDTLLQKCSDNTSALTEDESIVLQLIVQKYTIHTAALLQLESSPWELLLRIMSLTTSVCPRHPPPIMTVLGQVSNRFFQALPAEELRQHLFKTLVDTLFETKDVTVGNAVKNTILKVRCYVSWIG